MSAKKVTCGIKPTPQAPAAASADQWVASRTRETIKRLTLDLPASLHMRIKSIFERCIQQGTISFYAILWRNRDGFEGLTSHA